MAGLMDFLKGANDAAASNVYGPVEGLAWLLRKAGLPLPENSGVMGTQDWMREKGLLHPVETNRASAAGQAAGLIAPMAIAAKAPQISAGLLRMIDNANTPAAMNAATRGQAGAIVYHGSPHKFDKFDSTKIGTGEGAQAYGHGLYVADNPKTAMSYRASVSGTGPQFGLPDGDHAKGIATLIAARGDEGEKIARSAYASLGDDLEPTIARAKRAFDESSSLYKVDLPDEHIAKMLDWDKPLSQQAEGVRNAVGSLMEKRAAEAAAKTAELNALYPARMNHPVLSKLANRQQGDFDFKGSAAVEELVKALGGPAKASEHLNALGIPGIRYLDGGSRGAGAGSSNYVVFPGNEDLLKILERNGVPLNGK